MITAIVFAIAVVQKGLPDVVVSDQPHQSITLKLGQKVVFTVSKNASTGASWSVTNLPKHGLDFLGISDAPQSSTKPGMAGQQTTGLLTFKATKRGRYTVHLAYGRSWEMKKGVKPWEQVEATIFVK